MATKTKKNIVDEIENPFVEEPAAPSLQDQVADTLAKDGTLVQDEKTVLSVAHVLQFIEIAKEAGIDPQVFEGDADSAALGMLRIIVDLKQRIDRLEKTGVRPQQNPAKSRFERSVPTGVDLTVIPGFKNCSCLTKLAPGEKCNAHQRPGNGDGICPEAFKAAKMLESNVPLEIVQKRFAKA